MSPIFMPPDLICLPSQQRETDVKAPTPLMNPEHGWPGCLTSILVLVSLFMCVCSMHSHPPSILTFFSLSLMQQHCNPTTILLMASCRWRRESDAPLLYGGRASATLPFGGRWLTGGGGRGEE